MDKYIIYCTEEQTRKALELGAPITLFSDSGHVTEDTAKKWHMCVLDSKSYIIPTSEQMIGWLEEQESIKEVSVFSDVTEWNWTFDGYKEDGGYAFASRDSYSNRKEATLASINAALDYLNKKMI